MEWRTSPIPRRTDRTTSTARIWAVEREVPLPQCQEEEEEEEMEWERDQTANDAIEEDGGKNNVSEYEQCREERIRENLERMQRLGIFELSRAFQSSKPAVVTRKTRKSKTPRPLSPVPRPQPIRRSSRYTLRSFLLPFSNSFVSGMCLFTLRNQRKFLCYFSFL